MLSPVLPLQMYCGGALVLNAASKGSALSGGGAYINDVDSIALYQNEWSNHVAEVGAGAVTFHSVKSAEIANETFFKYVLPSTLLRHSHKTIPDLQMPLQNLDNKGSGPGEVKVCIPYSTLGPRALVTIG